MVWGNICSCSGDRIDHLCITLFFFVSCVDINRILINTEIEIDITKFQSFQVLAKRINDTSIPIVPFPIIFIEASVWRKKSSTSLPYLNHKYGKRPSIIIVALCSLQGGKEKTILSHFYDSFTVWNKFAGISPDDWMPIIISRNDLFSVECITSRLRISSEYTETNFCVKCACLARRLASF